MPGAAKWEIKVKNPKTGEEVLCLTSKDKKIMMEEINELMRELKCDERLKSDDLRILNSPSQRAKRPKWAERMDKWIMIRKIHKYQEDEKIKSSKSTSSGEETASEE